MLKTAHTPSSSRKHRTTTTTHHKTATTAPLITQQTRAYRHNNNHRRKNMGGKNNRDDNNKRQKKDTPKVDPFSTPLSQLDPVLHSVQNISALSRTYSDHRPRWATDLEASLSDDHPVDISNPTVNYPELKFSPAELQADHSEVQVHANTKLPMLFSADVAGEVSAEDYQNVLIAKKMVKAPKNNTMMMVGYRGTGYNGSQIQFINGVMNPNTITIEQKLLEGLTAIGYITPANAELPQKVKWSRGARTDKGVHAACNSLNARLLVPYLDMVPEAMYVYKKATKYSTLRYKTLYPLMESHLLNKINNATTKVIEAEAENDDINAPVLLTTDVAQIPLLLKQHIAVNIVGDLTISPNMIHTLKKFGIYTEQDTLESIQKDFVDNTPTAQDTSSALPTHAFTAWEVKLLELVVEFGKEWDSMKKKPPTGLGEDEDDEIPNGTTNVKPTDWGRAKSSTQMSYHQRIGFTEEDVGRLINADFFSDTFRARLRPHLPKQIHVLRACRVAASFDSKESASSRTYEYIIPSFAFKHLSTYPPGLHDAMLSLVMKNKETFEAEMVEFLAQKQAQMDAERQAAQTTTDIAGMDDGAGDDVQKAAEVADAHSKQKNNKKRSRDNKQQNQQDDEEEDEEEEGGDKALNAPKGFEKALTEGLQQIPAEVLNHRLSAAELANIQHCLSYYVGTRHYWNFTARIGAHEQQGLRNIRSFVPVGTFVINNVEFIHMVVHGDSFLLNQIRKMVGFVIGVVRGNYDGIDTTEAKARLAQDIDVVPRRLDLLYPKNGTHLPRPGSNASREEHDAYRAKLVNHFDPEKLAEEEKLVSEKVKAVANTVFSVAFSKYKQFLPIAPALGLLLDRVHHDWYDEKVYSTNPGNAAGGRLQMIRDTTFSNFTRARDFFGEVKRKEIYKEICIQELSTSSAWNWLHLLNMGNMHMNAEDVENAVNAQLESNQVRFVVTNHIAASAKDTAAGGVVMETSEELRALNRQARKNQRLVDVHGAEGNMVTNELEYVHLVEKTKANIPMFDQKQQ